MKVELIGRDYQKNPNFLYKHGVSWELWLNENICIARGWSTRRSAAERAGTKAFEAFKRALAHRKKPIRFQEWE